MKRTIEFFFDVGSPASYLAWTQLPALAERTGAELVWKPMLLGAVFKATGNRSPATVEAKSRYNRRDLQRYASHYGVDLHFNPYFPVNTLMLMRGAAAYLGTPRLQSYLAAVHRAMWVEEQAMGDPVIVASVLAKAGFDPEEVLALCNDPQIKNRLRETTEEAVERGVFGAPTMFAGNEMFFGQDRLRMLEEWLTTT